MIDVEVISLTQKSWLHGKDRPIHLADDPLSEGRGIWTGSGDYELRVVQTARRNPQYDITASSCAAEQDGYRPQN
jgi:hypothetical protein